MRRAIWFRQLFGVDGERGLDSASASTTSCGGTWTAQAPYTQSPRLRPPIVHTPVPTIGHLAPERWWNQAISPQLLIMCILLRIHNQKMQPLRVLLCRYDDICNVKNMKKPIYLGDYSYGTFAYYDSCSACARYRVNTLGC